MKTTLLLLLVVSLVFSQDCSITAPDIEGPYYVRNAPTKVATVCENNPAEDRLILSGHVYGDCVTPLAGVKLDIWHADPTGKYSPGGSDYTCRSVLFTDSHGFYQFTSLMPGRYDDDGYRPAHIHFKIGDNVATKYNNFTTQLYFHQDPYTYPNDSCGPCHSNQKTLLSTLAHVSDIKTYVGSWNINIRSRKPGVQNLPVTNTGTSYITKKDHILRKPTYNEEEVQKLLAEKDQMMDLLLKQIQEQDKN